MCVCVCVCVRARACVCVCVRARACVCMLSGLLYKVVNCLLETNLVWWHTFVVFECVSTTVSTTEVTAELSYRTFRMGTTSFNTHTCLVFLHKWTVPLDSCKQTNKRADLKRVHYNKICTLHRWSIVIRSIARSPMITSGYQHRLGWDIKCLQILHSRLTALRNQTQFFK